MKIRMSKSELVRSFSKVQGIVERRNTLPILSYALVKAEGSGVDIVSTDLEVGLKGSYSAEIVEPGAVTVMAKKAFEIARELPEEEVEISSEENNWVRMVSGKADFRMVGLPKEDFPELPEYSQEAGLWLSRNSILEMIKMTHFAISHDHTRYALNGVLLEVTTIEGEGGNQVCRMVSTDGHRLALIESSSARGNTEERSIIVPRKAVVELKKILDEGEGEGINVDFSKNHVFFIDGEVVLTARLIEGQFPEYQQVVPKESRKRTTIDREEFHRVLKRVSILTADRSNPVRFAFSEGQMTISTNNPDVGEASENMEVDYSGEDIELGFNARYVLDVLAALDVEKVVLAMNEPLSPGLLTLEENGNYKYVVMPMRL
jgi:DNA polymerase-3 subunit beta